MNLDDLSINGGIVNAFNALSKAATVKGERKIEIEVVKPESKTGKKGKN
jgi:hypothetical protein